MNFDLNEETILLKESASRFLEEKSPAAQVKALSEDKDGFSRTVWNEMAALGWFGMIYEEAYGGFEASFFDLFILFQEMGKVVLQSPFFCSPALSGMLISETECVRTKSTYLPSIISGEKIYTTALLNKKGQYDFAHPDISAQKTGDGTYEIVGTRLLVPYAHVADGILVCAGDPGPDSEGSTIFMIDGSAPGLVLTPLDTLTREKSFAVTFQNVQVKRDDIIGSPGRGSNYLAEIIPKATILTCGEMLGGLKQVMDLTVSHVQDRHQFGRPLCAFQAVQHNSADMAILYETTRLITFQAASLLSEGMPCSKEVAMAKAWCSDAYTRCTRIGHQLHGAIGFTEEHDMHLYSKHARVSEMAFGHSWNNRDKVASEMGL